MRVYHLDSSLMGCHRWTAEKAADAHAYWRNGKYRLVADVGGSDIETAYRLTNHIDSDWTENADVKAQPGPHRSSCPGDIVVVGDKAHLCLSIGWAELGVLPLPETQS